MKNISVKELKKMMDEKQDFQLIDVREPFEFEIANMGGELIPMATIPEKLDAIAKDKMVIIHCKSGGRSGRIIEFLEENHGFDNLYNLAGGITAWADEIDTTVAKY